MIKLFCDFCSNELTDKDIQYMGYSRKEPPIEICHCPSCSRKVNLLIRKGEYDSFVKERFEQIEKEGNE